MRVEARTASLVLQVYWFGVEFPLAEGGLGLIVGWTVGVLSALINSILHCGESPVLSEMQRSGRYFGVRPELSRLILVGEIGAGILLVGVYVSFIKAQLSGFTELNNATLTSLRFLLRFQASIPFDEL